ncbi:MAG: hypothetical protein LJE62_13735 [Silicimonas sp.]|jgi:hypothetical protein|nr:hypothetical protein [Silicimonas sp.]
MIRRLARSFSLLANAGLAALVVGAAFPGTHRVVMPDAYGLTEIADRVWTDAPSRADEFLRLVRTARDTVGDFFGDPPPNPTLILCATAACARNFGIGGNGLSFVDMAVFIGPGGLTIGTLTHEMTHSRLHRRLGLRHVINQPFPTWFDEGLATHVAGHPRQPALVNAEARQMVRGVTRFWQWDNVYRDIGVARAYSAAAAEVEAIENKVGRNGLLELVARTEAGGDFNVILNNLLAR